MAAQLAKMGGSIVSPTEFQFELLMVFFCNPCWAVAIATGSNGQQQTQETVNSEHTSTNSRALGGRA
jgi:hypothetical protein